jgi:BirA family biotin operon repressor/biotin-[acetyl-CoA-carboxylase] ligase
VSAGAALPALGEFAAAWPRELAGLPLLVRRTLDSTQCFARRFLDRTLAESEEPLPFVVVALEQSAGQGRRGRAWRSAPGLGLWATAVLAVEREVVPTVPMRAGVALAEVCRAFVGGVRLKWPNDLVCGRRKLGGLLVDAVGRPGGASWALIGFGVDCFHSERELPEPRATSLALAGGEPPGLALLLPRFVAAIVERVATENDWLERYRVLSAHAPGDPIGATVDGERIEGRFLGFDRHGFLRLATAAGERVVASGDVGSW